MDALFGDLVDETDGVLVQALEEDEGDQVIDLLPGERLLQLLLPELTKHRMHTPHIHGLPLLQKIQLIRFVPQQQPYTLHNRLKLLDDPPLHLRPLLLRRLDNLIDALIGLDLVALDPLQVLDEVEHEVFVDG